VPVASAGTRAAVYLASVHGLAPSVSVVDTQFPLESLRPR